MLCLFPAVMLALVLVTPQDTAAEPIKGKAREAVIAAKASQWNLWLAIEPRVPPGAIPSDAGPARYAPATYNNTYLYDPVTSSWSAGPSLNEARSYGDAGTINTPNGETAIVVAGYNNVNLWLDSVEASTLPGLLCATVTMTITPAIGATTTSTPTRTSTAVVTTVPPTRRPSRTCPPPIPSTGGLRGWRWTGRSLGMRVEGRASHACHPRTGRTSGPT